MTPTFLAGRPAKACPLDSGFPRRQVRNHTVALRRAVRLRVSDASTPSGGRPGLTSLGGPHPTRRPTSGLGSATPALVAVELAVADPHPTPRDLARPVFKPNLAQGVGYPTPFRPPPTVRNPCVQAKPGGRARVSRPIRAPSTGRNPCVQARSGPGAPKSFWLRSQTCCLWPFRACVPRGPRVCRQGSGLLDIPRVESPRTPARARHVTESLLGPVPIRVRLRPPLRRDLPVPTGVIDLPAPRRPGGRAWRGNQFLQAVQGGYGRA
jgi:hypothetical protein